MHCNIFCLYRTANHARAVHKTRKKTPLYNHNSTGGILISYVSNAFGASTHSERAGNAHNSNRVAPSRENSFSISHKAAHNSYIPRSKRSAAVAVSDSNTDARTEIYADVNTDTRTDVESAGAGGGGGDNSGGGAESPVGLSQRESTQSGPSLAAQVPQQPSAAAPLHLVNSTDTCATSISVSGKLQTIQEQDSDKKISKMVSFQVEERPI